MSLRRKNSRANEIELDSVEHFLKVILAMGGGLTVLTLIGMMCSAAIGGNTVLYQMTLIVDGILIFGGTAGLKGLSRRNKSLKERREADAGRI